MQTQLQFSSLQRWAEKWPPTNIHIKSPEPVNVTELRILGKKRSLSWSIRWALNTITCILNRRHTAKTGTRRKRGCDGRRRDSSNAIISQKGQSSYQSWKRQAGFYPEHLEKAQFCQIFNFEPL